MAKLSISLLGRYEVTLDGRPIVDFESDRVRMLLAYLSVESDRVHNRSVLAGLFWPDQPESTARTNLRHVLLNLRTAIDDVRASPPFLLTTHQTIQWNPASNTWRDVAALSALLALCKTHSHQRVEDCSECADRLQQAVALYRGDFLAGISLPDSRALEEWAQIAQERLHQQALEALYYLAAYHEAHSQFDEAAQMARRQVELEPWREEAYRQLMRDLALAGRRSEALAQFKVCRDILIKELGVEPSLETIELYERIKAARLQPASSSTESTAPAIISAVSPSTSALHNLPHDFNAFIGRSSERAEIHARLNQPYCRLVTLVGPGGSGKSRLAVAAARERLSEYADGVWFVSLVGVNGQSTEPLANTLESIATAIAGTLGLQLVSGLTPSAQLLKYLSDKYTLLILDNFEHLLEGVDIVRDIVDRAPHVQLLVTSRQVLNLQREWLLEVAGLPYSSSDSDHAAADRQPAVLLFEERRRQVQPATVNAPEERLAIRRICQLVEGMPLAIELAASLTRTAQCATIAAIITQHLSELATNLRDLPARQRSLRAVFDASWQQLTSDEQRLLAQLSVFQGGFTADAAAHVAQATEAMLIALQDKSFLHQPDLARYTLHEVLRYFAAEKLVALEGPTRQTAARHRAYYLSRIGQHASTLGGAHSQQAVQDILADLDNVRQAWQSALDESDIALIQRSESALFLFYRLSGLMREGIAVLAQAIERLNQLIENAAEPSSEIGWVLDRLYTAQCHFFRRLGQYVPALEAAREAIRLAQAVGDSVGEAGAHYVAGLVLWYQGRYADARQQADDALRQYQQLHDQLGESRTYNLFGLIVDQWGDYAAARSCYEHALTLSRSIGDRLGESMELSNLGALAGKQGNYEQERSYYIQAKPIVQESSETRLYGQLLNDLGYNSYALGETTQARIYYEQALSILRDAGDQAWESVALLRTSLLFERLNKLELAYDHCQQALAIARSIGQRDYESAALTQLGNLCSANRHWAEAEAHYQAALVLRRTLGQPQCMPELQSALAWIAVQLGNTAAAKQYVDALFQYLETNATLAGTVEPLRVFQTVYEILKSIADARATDISEKSYHLLQAQSARIANEELRQSFLYNVPTHQAIMARWASARQEP